MRCSQEKLDALHVHRSKTFTKYNSKLWNKLWNKLAGTGSNQVDGIAKYSTLPHTHCTIRFKMEVPPLHTRTHTHTPKKSEFIYVSLRLLLCASKYSCSCCRDMSCLRDTAHRFTGHKLGAMWACIDTSFTISDPQMMLWDDVITRADRFLSALTEASCAPGITTMQHWEKIPMFLTLEKYTANIRLSLLVAPLLSCKRVF